MAQLGSTKIFGDLTITGKTSIAPTSVSDGLLYSVATVAAAGTTQAGATEISKDFNVVSSGTGGVRLPVASVGEVMTVFNNTASAINIYPATSGYIDGLAVNTALSLMAYGSARFYAYDATHWESTLDIVTNASKISGTLATGIGGTGLTSFTANGAVYATSTSALTTGTLPLASGGTGSTTAAGARTNLGATTVGSNMFTLTNPGAVTFPRFNADNTVSALDAATFRTAIGAGVPYTYTLPVATTSVLGGVKDGTGVTIAADGTISVDYGSSTGTAVQGNDTRVTADQAAATASIRTLGTGSLQAAAGDHNHNGTYAPLNNPELTGQVNVSGNFAIKTAPIPEKQMVFYLDSAIDLYKIQAVHQGVSYKTLSLNPDGGSVSLPSATSIGNVSSTEIGYLDGVTSAIQTQINSKIPNLVVATIGASADGTDANTYAFVTGSYNVGPYTANMPEANAWWHVFVEKRDDSNGFMIAASASNGGSSVWSRTKVDGTLGTWYKQLNSSNYSSYALPRSGGTMVGNIIMEKATSPNIYYLQFGDNTGWAYRFMTDVSGTPTTRFTFTDTGNFTAVGNITAYSDERLKSNIQTIPNALEKVQLLRGVEFDKDGKHQIGVIAQEVQKVIPEVVQEGEYLSVAYGNMVGLLIEAIKEQQKQIEELKEMVKAYGTSV